MRPIFYKFSSNVHMHIAFRPIPLAVHFAMRNESSAWSSASMKLISFFLLFYFLFFAELSIGSTSSQPMPFSRVPVSRSIDVRPSYVGLRRRQRLCGWVGRVTRTVSQYHLPTRSVCLQRSRMHRRSSAVQWTTRLHRWQRWTRLWYVLM